MTPVVIYAPTARNRTTLIEQCQQHCQREGYQAVAITPLPAEALRLVATGEAVTIVHARRRDARALRPPLEQARQSRLGPPLAATGAVVGAGLLAFGKRAWQHKVGTVATAAMVTTMVAGPMLSPDLPDLVPPPIAAPPPVEVYPDLPAPEPAPEPTADPEPPAAQPPELLPPAAVEVPEMEPVAVEVPAPPAGPEPEPTGPPQTNPPAPTPAPNPPEPTPTPTMPPEPPVDDPPLLCLDLGVLGLIQLDVCLLP